MTNPQDIAKHFKIFPCCGLNVRSFSESGKKMDAKQPLTMHGFKDASSDPEKIKAWFSRWPSALIGIPGKPNGVIWIDIDPPGMETWGAWIKEHGDLAAGPMQKTPRGGLHIGFKHPLEDVPNNAGKVAPGIDIRSEGYICTGTGYTWLPGHDYNALIPEMPAWLQEKIKPKKPEKVDMRMGTPATVGDPADAGQYWLKWALDKAQPGNRNETGFNLALQLRDSGINAGSARVVMQEYAANVPGADYTAGEALASLAQVYQLPPREPAALPKVQTIELQEIYHMTDEQEEIKTLDLKNPPEKKIIFVSGYECTDSGNGKRFINLHGDQLRFVEATGRWFVWNGRRWEKDQDGAAERKAKETARGILQEAYQETDKDKAKQLTAWAFKSQSRASINNMLELAKSESGITVPIDQFDQDPYYLNFRNGTVDLRTGELREHRPGDYITKMVSMSYNERAKCPMWLKFLNEIMDGNTRLIDFLQRAIGYSLTGLTTEQLFLILWGIGANGKSVFSETILGMLGEDYARNAQAKTILTRDGRGDSGINNDLARLRGIRFVTVNEIPGRGRLDEAKVKELTGTDTITARFLFHEPFQFQPPFKIWIRTNHKPIITGTDPGIWRRVRLVPFNVSIPPEEQDKHLIEKLRDEYPGIMAWAVMGCLTWLDEGLTFPDEVRAATAEYKADSDTFQPFLEECCIIDKTATTTAASLYEKYKEWATTNNERPMTKNMFGRELSERGFDKFRPGTTGPTTYSGIGLAGDK